MKYLSIETHGRKRRICFLTTSYAQNGNLAVLSYEENGEPFADVTVNFYFLEPGCAFIDANNFPEIGNILEQEGIATPLNQYKRSGYCDYPLYEFNMARLADYSMPGSDYFLI